MKMLEVKDRFYVDVVSCAAPCHPETAEVSNGMAGHLMRDWKGAGIEQAIFAIPDDSAGKLVF
jgi:hypothetical protein